MRETELTARARDMRKGMTEPETRLWLELRAGRFHGIKFRRQKVIGRYIADFAANHPKLVIELDGDTHVGQLDYDAERTSYLEAQGYRVARFSNGEVIENMDGVLQRLGAIVEMLRHAPPPTPSPEGEGA
ncbi:endonuclease domain-containing protein [Citromicrobium bathyomarinum]|uniref:endonuclease domain-containing protein n=1 Tax=Citromicrobium bathyomarinum TaxID=72174 RepID=UPI00315B2C79